MDENRPVYPLNRPGRYSPWVNEYLVGREVTRDEIIDGQRVVASPDEPPQAILQSRLYCFLNAHVAPGYRVTALLDAAIADNAVVEALAAKDNPAIRQREAAVEAKAILTVLDARGISVSPAQRQEILSCQDADRLDRWLRRSAVASSVDEVTSEG